MAVADTYTMSRQIVRNRPLSLCYPSKKSLNHFVTNEYDAESSPHNCINKRYSATFCSVPSYNLSKSSDQHASLELLFPTSSDSQEHENNCVAPGPTSCVFLERALKRIYPRDDFEILESLGEGFFSNVFKVRLSYADEVMVLKILKERENRHRSKASVLKEVAVLNQLVAHPNVIAFRGVCIDSREGMWNMHILIDFCDGGSLNRLITDTSKHFPWEMRCYLAKDISTAMTFVHSKNVMHRDLTSMNVLLQTVPSNNLKAVVADFGLSCTIPSEYERLVQVGTPFWMAPECLKEEFYNEKADVFSFGIILCQMIARIEADPEAGLCRTNNFGLDYVRYTARCENDTPLDLLQLAFHCCLMNPSGRPSFANVSDRLNRFIEYNWKGDFAHRISNSMDEGFQRSLSETAFDMSDQDLYLHVQCASMNESVVSRYLHSNKVIRRNRSGIGSTRRNSFCFCASTEVEETVDKKTKMKELAWSIAVEELSESPPVRGNPFLNHQIYSTTRKLGPFKRSRKSIQQRLSNLVHNRKFSHKSEKYRRVRCNSFPGSPLPHYQVFSSTFPRRCYNQQHLWSDTEEPMTADFHHKKPMLDRKFMEHCSKERIVANEEKYDGKGNRGNYTQYVLSGEQNHPNRATIRYVRLKNRLASDPLLDFEGSEGPEISPSSQRNSVSLDISYSEHFKSQELFVSDDFSVRDHLRQQELINSVVNSAIEIPTSLACFSSYKPFYPKFGIEKAHAFARLRQKWGCCIH